jgi:hypothetical protein
LFLYLSDNHIFFLSCTIFYTPTSIVILFLPFFVCPKFRGKFIIPEYIFKYLRGALTAITNCQIEGYKLDRLNLQHPHPVPRSPSLPLACPATKGRTEGHIEGPCHPFPKFPRQSSGAFLTKYPDIL